MINFFTIYDLLMVEAAGVEPAVDTENTQVTEIENSKNVPSLSIAWFAYKSRTNNLRNSQNSNSCTSGPLQRAI
jgi:hypothetical protein